MFLGCDNMKIGIASDHRGYQMKTKIVKYLQKKHYEVIDYGTKDGKESVDYPDFAHPLANAIESGECYPGFAFCGSGNGINMTLNKHQKIREQI